MDSKSKDSGKTKDVLRQLQAELRQLQTTVNGLQSVGPHAEPVAEKPVRSDLIVQYAVQKSAPAAFTEAQLARVGDDAAATLGNAVSSPQKVALLRALLALPGGESAAFLGEAAGLSTGSLYHHLHDLMHAGLLGQAGRNRYVLTDRGKRVLLVLLALAVQS